MHCKLLIQDVNMEKDYLKYYHPKFFISLIIAGFILIYLANTSLGLSLSVFGALSLLIVLITQYLWKYKPFKWLFWIDDFSGRYEGKLVYKYRGDAGQVQTGELDHVKIICQTGSRITIHSFTRKADGAKSSLSVNKGMYVEKTEDETHYKLIYSYQNGGSVEQGFSGHYGTEVIKFINKGQHKELSGEYFTDRDPYQTKGEFKNLKWVSNNKTHDF
ncbi:hypothetical protein [Galbibacter orientalis]|uniref:Cap15 family cyclic dinucleotide receptor domain-containing protein n=1 Tax=Galbibacter orientalis TaxID=453852 RepID=UPI003080FFFA